MKKKALLIAEKPSLMKQIKAVYDKEGHELDITFKAFAGHTMSLASPKEHNSEWEKWKLDTLPMIPDEFMYVVTPDKIKMYNDIKSELNKDYDFVINACDGAREGQLIFYSFFHSLKLKKQPPVLRFWSNDLTDKEISRALNDLQDDESGWLKDMTTASKLRANFDWLVGLNLSRAYSLKINNTARIGRVKTPTLKILVDRENEVLNFVPKDFWEVKGIFTGYDGTYFSEDETGMQTQIYDKKEADKVMSGISDKGEIIQVSKKEEVKYAPELYSLSSLQSDGNKLFGYTLTETLAIAQSLYDKGILSYPRTSSSHLTDNLAKTFKDILKPILDIDEYKDLAKDIISDNSLLAEVSKNKKYVDDKKVSDHYALVLTGQEFVMNLLTKDEKNIMNMVTKRLLSIFMPPMKTDKTLLVTKSNEYKFRTNGSIIKDLGYMALFDYKSQDTTLPNVEKGDIVDLEKCELITKKTMPPKRFTEGQLVSVMKQPSKFLNDDGLKSIIVSSEGIGTEATRAGILEELIGGKMILRKGKIISPTDYGMDLIRSIGEHSITSVDLTANWETKLTNIEKGTLSGEDFEKEMIKFVNDEIADIKSKSYEDLGDGEQQAEIVGTCPICKSNIIIGKTFYLCENYKNEDTTKACTFVLPMVFCKAKITKTDVKKLLAGEETAEKNFVWKSGSKGKAKIRLKDNSADIDLVFSNSNSTGGASASTETFGKCIKCGEPLKETAKFFMCTKYKDPCTVIIGKEIQGAKVTKKDVDDLMSGKETASKEFTWKSGNKGNAKMKMNKEGKLEFVFATRK